MFLIEEDRSVFLVCIIVGLCGLIVVLLTTVLLLLRRFVEFSSYRFLIYSINFTIQKKISKLQVHVFVKYYKTKKKLSHQIFTTK